MNPLASLADFFLSSWIWNMTLDWMHPIATGLILYLLIRIFLRKKRIRAFIIAGSAQFAAFTLLTAIVISGVFDQYQVTFENLPPEKVFIMLNEFYPSLSLALIYAIFQTIYFFIGSLFFGYKSLPYIVCVWLSNGAGFSMSVMLIRALQVWYYGIFIK